MIEKHYLREFESNFVSHFNVKIFNHRTQEKVNFIAISHRLFTIFIFELEKCFADEINNY